MMEEYSAYNSTDINPEFVKPHRYKAMLETLKDNIPNIDHLPGSDTVRIKKKDMIFEVTHPEEVREIMELMFKINNFICRQYRRRKHILKSTEIINEQG